MTDKNTTAVEAVENTVNQILESNEKTISQLREEIEKEEAKIASASSAKETAKNNGDISGYRKANAEILEATDAKMIYEEMYNKLDGKPLISEAEYKKMVSDIESEIYALEEETRKELAQYSELMEEKALYLQERQAKANTVLKRLQGDVFKDADRWRDANGRIGYLPHENKEVNAWETVGWGKAGVDHYQYKLFIAEKEEKEKPVSSDGN
jgi:hypothetical protein